MYFLIKIYILLLTPNVADAYIDPGSSGMIIQFIVGGIVGFFMFIKMYWKKITDFFKRKTSNDK